ncbi:hypothetical protein [Nocardia nepalensis]
MRARAQRILRARKDRREWTAEELAYLDKIQEQLAGPLTERQLAILRRW